MAMEDTCIICCHTSDLFCVGRCDHPVCFECATRLRVLCDSRECSICRSDLDTIYVLHSRPNCDSLYNSVVVKMSSKFATSKIGRSYGFVFETPEASYAVADLLIHICTFCKQEPEFENFELLSRHMRREHNLFFCELCTEHLTLFSWERKFYTRQELARHKRLGDSNDKSHKGHPLCNFCDQRFLDSDLLFRHLRRDHYFCHFCDADGKNQFFREVIELKEHLRLEHFLCEMGRCKDEEHGISFRHEIDFKAHKAAVHAKDMQKGDLRKELQVNVAFNYGPTPLRERFFQNPRRPPGSLPDPSGGRGRSSPDHSKNHFKNGSAASAGSSRSTALNPLADQLAARPPPSGKSLSSFQLASQDFPSLGGLKRTTAAPSSGSGATHSLANVVDGTYYGAGGVSDDDGFPALGQASGRRRRRGDSSQGSKLQDDGATAAPPPTVSKPSTFVIIDDDEAPKGWHAAAAASSSARGSLKAAIQKPKSENQSSWVQPKIAGMSVAEFPDLPHNVTKPKAAIFKNNVKTAKNSEWSKKTGTDLTKKPENQPKLKTSSSEINMKSIGEFLEMQSLPKPTARARLVSNPRKVSQGENSAAAKVIEANAKKTFTSDNSLPQETPQLPLGPPPGLDRMPAAHLKFVQQSLVAPPPGFCASNASTRDFDVSKSHYRKPGNFQQRNKALMDLLQSSLNQEELSDFKKLSHNYRRSLVDPKDFYMKIRALLGSDLFDGVFQELLCLLPDIQLQNDLFDLYPATFSGRKLANCQLCRQVLPPEDLNEHLAFHLKPNVNKDYPPLC